MNYADFFTNVRELCSRISRPPEDLGFNPFALMSDMYYRENFHSDIIAAILDPKGSHNEKWLFLRSFVDLLASLADEQCKPAIAEKLRNLRVNDEIVVSREDYRTDIAIYSARDHWSILVENKINNAVDQDRQLIRYLNDWTKDKLDVKPVAIVYLTPTDWKAQPEMSNWTEKEKCDVKKLLISLSGYASSKKCLYDWLRKCELESVIFNNKALLAQYASLIKQQAGVDMNERDFVALLKQADESQICIYDLNSTLNQLPQFYASWLKDALLLDNELDADIFTYPKVAGKICVLDFQLHLDKSDNGITLTLEVTCDKLTEDSAICFWERSSEHLDTLSLFKDVLEQRGYYMKSQEDGVYWWQKKGCQSKLPNYRELEQLLTDLRQTAKAIKERKDEIEKS